MNQQSISQSTENENEGGGLTLISVKFKNELKRLRDVNGLHATPRTIYLDATGIAKDELINLHLFIPSNGILYTVNVRKLGDAAFSAVGNSEISLRVLLESTKIPEVGFDIRDISRILFHRFKMSLGGVHDIQLLELASRKDGQQKKFLSGLTSCIEQDISNEDPGKIRWHNPDDAKDLRFYQ
ncbi:Ribonuclease H superfamily [Fusarium oxysporum f. sp. vasinfectum]|nr:Ribonuclease H superfamily [Fusarium oxysporum f. sp. vasinfectum]KAK2925074.1 Ribonuclease H superfamily [Fusarium oxysporum f. sp. vasinfectum]